MEKVKDPRGHFCTFRHFLLIQQMKDGFQIMPDGEEIYAVKNPALDVWKTGISA